MVLLPARTGPENGSRSEVHPNGSNWVRPDRTVPNLNFDFQLNLRLQTMIFGIRTLDYCNHSIFGLFKTLKNLTC